MRELRVSALRVLSPRDDGLCYPKKIALAEVNTVVA